MQNTLTELRSWKLDHKKDDIRGWSLRDPDGILLGTVDELIVDTDSRHVTQVVLDDGKRYSAHDVLIGDGELKLASAKQKAAAKATVPAPAPRDTAPKPDLKTDVMKTDVVRSDRDLVVPVIEEQIRVGKRQVNAGGMHVESKIVTEPIDEEVRLREERVTIERHAVDQPLTLADADARLHEGVVELRATVEQAVVEKRARVVEEVLLKKDSTEHVEHVRDSIRHTEVQISEVGGNGAPRTKQGVKP